MFVYILQSINTPQSYYIGLTKNIEERITQHNNGQVSHTSKYKPWRIKNYFWFDSEAKAVQFERYLKSGSGKAFCKKHF